MKKCNIKGLFTNKNKLAYWTLVSLAIIISGVIVLCTIGMNKSVAYAGGTQITVETGEEKQIVTAKKEADKLFTEYGIKVDREINSTNGAEYQLVLQSKEAIPDELQAKLKTALSDDAYTTVSDVEQFSSSFTGKAWVIVVAICALLLLVFIATIIRYKSINAICTTFVTLLATGLTYFIIVLSRIPFGAQTFVAIAIAGLITPISMIALLERIKESKTHSQNANKTETEISTQSIKENLFFDIILATIGIAVCIIMCAMGSLESILLGVSFFVALVVSFFSSHLFGMSLCDCTISAYKNSRKQKMSVLESQTQKQAKPQTEKAKKQKTARPEKVQEEIATKSTISKKKRKKRAKGKEVNKVVV